MLILLITQKKQKKLLVIFNYTFIYSDYTYDFNI